MTASAYNNRFIFAFIGLVFITALGISLAFNSNWWLLIPFAVLLVISAWQNPAFLFYLLVLVLPFSFEYNFSPTLATDVPDESLMWACTAIFIASFLFRIEWYRPYLKHPLVWLLFIQLLWILLSAVTSTFPLLSLKLLLAKSWYIAAFVFIPLLILSKPSALKKIAIILSGSMFVVTLIILFRHLNLDFEFASINKAVVPFFRNHVNYSAMLVCLIPVFLCFYSLTANKTLRIFLVVTILILLSALLLSFARGAWLALFTGLLGYFLLHRRWLFRTYIIVLLISFFASAWLISNDNYLRFAHKYKTTIFHKDFREHLVATYELKDVSTAERFYRWIAGARMVKERWLTGFGPNTFVENYKPYAVPAFRTWVSDNKEHSTIHNYYLLVLVEQGMAGLAILLVLLGAMIYYAQRIYHRTNEKEVRSVIATITAMIVMIITVNALSDLIETDKIGSLFFMAIAILIYFDQKQKNLSASNN